MIPLCLIWYSAQLYEDSFAFGFLWEFIVL